MPGNWTSELPDKDEEIGHLINLFFVPYNKEQKRLQAELLRAYVNKL